MNNLKRLLTAAVTVCALAALVSAQDTGDSTDRSTVKPTTSAGHHHKTVSKNAHKGKTAPDNWAGSGGSAGKSGKGKGKNGGFPDDWSQQGQSSSTTTGGQGGKSKGKNGGFPDDWSQQGQGNSSGANGKGKGKHGGAPDDWSQQGQSAATGKSGKGKHKPKPKTAPDDWEASQPK